MSNPRVTFIDEIPEDHICTLCGEELNHLHEEYRRDGWIIEIWECSGCRDGFYIRLGYQYDPEQQETVGKLRSLLYEINSLEGIFRKATDGELAECPFCHKKEPLRIEWSGLVCRVICDAVVGGCGASIGWEFTQEKAIAKWNNRKEGSIMTDELNPCPFCEKQRTLTPKQRHAEELYDRLVDIIRNTEALCAKRHIETGNVRNFGIYKELIETIKAEEEAQS